MKLTIHHVLYKDGYGYADYCDCGEQSFVCQHCGVAYCITFLSKSLIDDKNTCIKCFDKNKEEIKEYDSMTEEAQKLYEILKAYYPKFKHEDIMDCVIGYANIRVYKKDLEE